MNTVVTARFILLAAVALASASAPGEAKAETKAASPSLTAAQIVVKVSESDPWGLNGADVTAKAIVTEKGGNTRTLSFFAKSRRYAPPLVKSVITFQAPADVAGTKFLQIQNASGDDERHLYTPDLKRTRRIAGSNRADSFMGTDFSYADLDGRDLRQSDAVLLADETMGKFECYHLSATPKNGDAVYSKLELWVRKDNFVPLKWIMFDKRSQPVKTLLSKEIQRHDGHWFIARSRMTDSTTGRTTELTLEKIEIKDDISPDMFSVRGIEKG